MKKLNVLKPLLKFMAFMLIFLFVSRLILSIVYFHRVLAISNWYLLFAYGIQMDLLFLSYFCFLPAILLLILPESVINKIRQFFRWYFIIIMFYMVFMELSTIPFINEYDMRPNRLFIEYLQYPHEVIGMLTKGFLAPLIIVSVLSVISVFLLIKLTRNWVVETNTKYIYKLILLPFVLILLLLCARSSTAKHPADPSTAAFSSDHLVNDLAISSGYSLYYAAYTMKDEKDAEKMYGHMDYDKALSTVKSDMHIPDSLFLNDVNSPLLHKQIPLKIRKRPYNLVVLLQESLGAEYVGALGGLPLTPNIDSLAKQGQLFTRLYSTGTRSVRGIEATVAGFPPTPSRSVVKLGYSQTNFFTIADLLKNRGYNTSFIYGGMATFDNMGSFFTGNGFEKIIDGNDYENFIFKGDWGVCDEDLYRKANETFNSYGDKPFFSLVFSTSNHTPYEFPDGRIKLYDKKKNTRNNAVKYADYSIGYFFNLARKSEYYKNTIFVIVADHDTRAYGNMLVPINKFHIPAIIIGPDVPKRTYNKICSQIDISPTALDYMGIENENPMPGRDLCQFPDSIPGRAILQFYSINAFLEGNKVLIMQPGKKISSFLYDRDKNTLKSTKPDPVMKDKALSIVSVATFLYHKRKYNIPHMKK